ncbi:MAG: SCO family protein [Ignavibacteria bacterium]|nr:SCO family protein [Ignavibacteria bacterium]MBT8392671.1 SCO family protein [Ignavibacteria bacterium]NNL20229.1 SCO family protein [Ignavibacteriaceae bacterium]
MKKIIKIFVTISLAMFIVSCTQDLPLYKDLTKKSYELVNQDSMRVIFPEVIKGNITVMGFIYTHCPDICPMTTHNMYLTEMKLKKEEIEDIKFVALSFDPERDKPSVLKRFAVMRDIDFKKWTLITGERKVTYDLLRRFDVRAVATDSVFYDDGEMSYSMMHTDRISLIDKDGRLRKNYVGSKINIEELIKDIKYLGEY